MKNAAQTNFLNLRIRQAHLPCDLRGEPGHGLRMNLRVIVPGIDGKSQSGHGIQKGQSLTVTLQHEVLEVLQVMIECLRPGRELALHGDAQAGLDKLALPVALR